MPKGAKPQFKTNSNSSSKKKAAAAKSNDDFDAMLQVAAQAASKVYAKEHHEKEVAVATAGGTDQAAAAEHLLRNQQHIDPTTLQYVQFLKKAKLLDQEIKKGETKADKKAREAKEQQMKEALFMQARGTVEAQRRQEQAEREAENARRMHYENVFIPLKDEEMQWTELAPGKWIRYEQFKNDSDMPMVCDLFVKNLSEPYTTFTYMHFMHGWKDLCIMLFGYEGKEKPAEDFRGTMVGCVVSRVTRMKLTYLPHGYVAMLAVEDGPFRGYKLGQQLVLKSVDLMKQKDCVVVQLETPCGNQRALDLYLKLGFVKTKYFVRYYMDGSDAVRLRLFTKPYNPKDMPLLDEDAN